MLNKKMVTAGFFGNGLLLLIAVNGTDKQSAATTNRLVNDTAILRLQAFDSSITGLNLSEVQLASAPKLPLNKRAVIFVNDYNRKNSASLEQVRGISTPYFTMMDSVFGKFSLPIELKYLAVIESRLKSKAVSPAGAVGPWQLMAATARIFSLKVKGKYDERTHYYKSTVAAARYLKDLYNEFGDWLLVIAAYNAGPGKVYSAIRKSGSRNFWNLQNYLPEETRLHVKKFIATHYYFEGHGSITTLTKAEVVNYRKAVAAYIEDRKQDQQTDIVSKMDVTKTNTPAQTKEIARSGGTTILE